MYNTSVILPNATILSKNVINWTLVERAVLIRVNVGVAYGSDLAMVTKLLKQAANDTEGIIHELDSIVMFDDFGSSSLDFSLNFYIVMKNHLQKNIVMSDVRYKINELFNANGLVIAFNQLDVHMDIAPHDLSQLPTQKSYL